jgi:CO/xanthine dehydrogenase Mo-binding subunit
VPRIETVLVRNDALPPRGGGEPAIVPTVFDATGARLLHLPLTAERIRTATRAAGAS